MPGALPYLRMGNAAALHSEACWQDSLTVTALIADVPRPAADNRLHQDHWTSNLRSVRPPCCRE
ncbi:hypothetical protein NCPPB940_25350 [Xanthomonas hortorum pv. taraxaci]|nr:hypothetical protein NCPPB940_25350 [Xanthomonas hortorum pv. taraxaci]CAD0336781.1 hypothetical protein NCPPB940_25350 [Xanthomonas hortorum pv. taraxaci]